MFTRRVESEGSSKGNPKFLFTTQLSTVLLPVLMRPCVVGLGSVVVPEKTTCGGPRTSRTILGVLTQVVSLTS